MKYACLIYEPTDLDPTPTQNDQIMKEYWEFTEAVKSAGKMLGGEALEPTATATTVRVRDGELLTTDGPFAETKEVLGGFYLIDCADLDEALQWAAKIPSAKWGSVEVRPVVVFE